MHSAENKTSPADALARPTGAAESNSPASGEERALRESEEKYRAVVQQVSEAIFLLDVEAMRLLEANPAFSRMLGYSSEEVLSLTIYDLLPYTRERIDRTTRRALVEGDYSVSDRLYRHKDGTLRSVEVGITQITYGGKIVLCEVLRDNTERKEAQEAVLSTERRLRALIENSADAIALIRADSTFSYVSPGVTGFLGYRPEELVGKNWLELIPEAERDVAASQFGDVAALPGASLTLQHSFMHSDGSVRWLESKLTNTLDDPAVGALVSNFRDLTESKRAEEELRGSRDQLEVILRSVRDGITAQGENGRLVYANEAALRMLDFSSQEDLLATDQARLMDKFELMDEDRNPLQPGELPARYALQGLEAPEKLVGWRLKRSGEEHWSLVKATPVKDETGKVQLAISIFRDITQSRKAEEALRLANRRFDLAARAVNALIYEWDIASDTVYRSPGLLGITGYSPDEVPVDNDWWRELIHPEDREWVQKQMDQTGAPGEGYSVEYRVRHRNGHYVYVWDRGLIERDAWGRAVRVVGSTLDITSRKELEQRKDDFIALASHELKTPASAIKGYAQLLGRDPRLASDERSARRLKSLDVAAGRLAELVNEMLDVSRINRRQMDFELQPVDLAEIVEEVAADMRVLSDRHRITVEISGPEGEPVRVSGDSERLRQVLTNLIGNALKYSPNGGPIDIGIRPEGGKVVVSVKDQGIGVPPEEIGRVFERFYRAPNASVHNYAGMGLGLSISYEIVQRHGGDMWVESAPGKGSCFFFALPLL